MNIKKVDDKPMVIHTKEKAKLHTHEPKQVSIKGSNIYTVDRNPTKKKSAESGSLQQGNTLTKYCIPVTFLKEKTDNYDCF